MTHEDSAPSPQTFADELSARLTIQQESPEPFDAGLRLMRCDCTASKPEPRVLEGDWETVRDALDALPEGAQIRWQEGYPLHSFVGMKTTSVFGDTRWSSVGSDGSFDHLSSTGIAHNDSPIEVIA